MDERADAPWIEPQSALLLGQTAAARPAWCTASCR
jgi:hypothetical protein